MKLNDELDNDKIVALARLESSHSSVVGECYQWPSLCYIEFANTSLKSCAFKRYVWEVQTSAACMVVLW